MTLLMLLLSIWVPHYVDSAEIGLFILTMVLVGIPHGATDYMITQYTQRGEKKAHGSLLSFLGSYVIAMIGFGLSWYWMPAISLWVFLIFSAFHFGQTQFSYIQASSNRRVAYALYVSWGLTILTAMIYFNSDEVAEILGPLKASLIFLGSEQGYWLPLGFLSITLILLVYFKGRNAIDIGYVGLEIVSLVSLMILFMEASLLIGFTLFFGAWHSIISIKTELVELQRMDKTFSVMAHVSKLIPYAVLSLVGIGLLVWVNERVIHVPQFSGLMLFFIAVSVLTFPHVYFRNKFFTLFLHAHDRHAVRHDIPEN